MKYPERLGRRGQRPFHTAITTTFAVEYPAFEELMLPQFAASGATNILLVADGRMSTLSLMDGSPLPQQLGRDYVMVSPPVSEGIFHPKIVLQLGRKVGRLFVGSANATAAGIAGNAEAIIEIECTDEPSAEREVVRAAWRYVVDTLRVNDEPGRDAIEWAVPRTPWLGGPDPEPVQDLEDGSRLGFLVPQFGANKGIAEQYIQLIGGTPVDHLVVVSPYWDTNLLALDRLVDALKPAATSVLLDREKHQFPIERGLPQGVNLRGLPFRLKGRFAHAKIFIACTATHDHLLIGSANCTLAALGRDGYAGDNFEACIYQMVPRGAAIEALDLAASLAAPALDPGEVKPRQQTPPIPLKEMEAGRAGSFEIEGDFLIWMPVRRDYGDGIVRLFDPRGAEVQAVELVNIDSSIARRSFKLSSNNIEAISFALVETIGFVSHLAHVTHRSVLRGKRREPAGGAVAKALSVFDLDNEIDLWMLGALDELAQADLADQAARLSATHAGRSKQDVEDKAPRHLTYEEFMETSSPDRQDAGRQDSTLTGAHSDSVRTFLNLLIGGTAARADVSDSDDDWMSLGDEDADGQLEEATARLEDDIKRAEDMTTGQKERAPVDAAKYAAAIKAYAANVASESRPIGPSEVLRLRFWLMLLLHKVRRPGLQGGLATSCDETGWPRMALRAISAFFVGKTPPIKRLMVLKEYTEMPVDYMECWATVIWTLDLLEAAMGSSPKETQFLGHVAKLRAVVLTTLALRPSEIGGSIVAEIWASLDATIKAAVLSGMSGGQRTLHPKVATSDRGQLTHQIAGSSPPRSQQRQRAAAK